MGLVWKSWIKMGLDFKKSIWDGMGMGLEKETHLTALWAGPGPTRIGPGRVWTVLDGSWTGPDSSRGFRVWQNPPLAGAKRGNFLRGTNPLTLKTFIVV